MAIAGEENIEGGKGISGLGCCAAGGGALAMPYEEERLVANCLAIAGWSGTNAILNSTTFPLRFPCASFSSQFQ